ncbi:molecular chaperone DnaK [Cohnella sp. CFH 77786]|uniref:TraR/DksA C4-type zinc finger protein n=1 Tax=Cohnella sp. CFH 77786 TaxID=2662265 RepID=UPI001C60810E|nr:TraR/DksA C4-type zinc finger protein [Cohnella sp. CFH 77786]MBW5444790.1 molecular chaperone DnaK [Cohnella sp. CFH 77786]
MSLPINQERMQELRQRLLQEKKELEERVGRNDHYQLSSALRDSIAELSAYDNHPADIGSETFERGKDLALLEREAFRLKRVEAALERMDTGEYGRCKECGAFISPERLDAMPTADHCAEHEPRSEISERRPVEEQFLRRPFGRHSKDEEDVTGFDGEDAWQIVSSWGNSNSPAMAEDNNIEEYDSVHIEAGENEGFVEPLESFLATDITGKHVSVVRNRQYYRYLDANEGDHLLEPDEYYDDR